MSSGDIPGFLERHRGLFTTEQIRQLNGATVAIAGVGGVGGRVAEVLARSGIGRLKLADPDHFSESNLNRQAASTLGNLGENKAEVVRDACLAVSPILDVEIFRDGVTPMNLDRFCEGADVIVDGTDYTIPSLGLMLARRAAAVNTPIVTGVEVAFSAWHTVIQGDGSFERLFGLPRSVTLEDLDRGRLEIPLWRWITAIPPYVSRAELKRLDAGEIEAPAIAPAVELSAAMISTDVIRVLLRQRVSVRAPRIHMVDVATGRSSKFRPTKARFYASLLPIAIRGGKA